MELISVGVSYLGIIILCIGAFCLLVQGFEKGTGWGLGMLLFGGILVPLFIIKYWKEASFWFYWVVVGMFLIYFF